MAHFTDLEQCTYFPGDTTHLVAIGWLEQGKPFQKGATPQGFVSRLKEVANSLWQPLVAAGPHFCDLCPPGSRFGGSDNLWILGDEAVFVTPKLIVHYVECHDYLPPEAFVAAVMRCPAMNSPEYEAAVRSLYWPDLTNANAKAIAKTASNEKPAPMRNDQGE